MVHKNIIGKKLKAYTTRYGLVVSKAIKSKEHLIEMLEQLCTITKVNKVYITNGKSSESISFDYKPPIKKMSYCIDVNGLKRYTLSIKPECYPITVINHDGSINIVDVH